MNRNRIESKQLHAGFIALLSTLLTFSKLPSSRHFINIPFRIASQVRQERILNLIGLAYETATTCFFYKLTFRNVDIIAAVDSYKKKCQLQ